KVRDEAEVTADEEVLHVVPEQPDDLRRTQDVVHAELVRDDALAANLPRPAGRIERKTGARGRRIAGRAVELLSVAALIIDVAGHDRIHREQRRGSRSKRDADEQAAKPLAAPPWQEYQRHGERRGARLRICRDPEEYRSQHIGHVTTEEAPVGP